MWDDMMYFFDIERARKLTEGAILGLAVGDALGVPVEFLKEETRKGNTLTGMVGGGVHGQPAATERRSLMMKQLRLSTIHQNALMRILAA